MLSFILPTYSKDLPKNIDGIEVIAPVSYQRESSTAQNLKSKSMLAIGNMVNYDVKAEVIKKLKPYENSLLPYFKDKNEYNNFINSTLDKGISTHLTKLNDPNMREFSKFLGNSLLAGVGARIMQKEGISNPTRRTAWLQKILAPFNQCIGKAENAYYDGLHCVDALSSSLVPTIGSAIVYEMSADKVAGALSDMYREAFNHQRVAHYQKCMSSTQNTPADVKRCALVSIKSGVSEVTEKNLSKILNSKIKSPNKVKTIKDIVLNDFNKCSDGVGKDTKSKIDLADQFKICIDNLVLKAGTLIVEESVATNDSVTDALGNKNANALASKKAQDFEKCYLDLKNRKVRGPDGLVDISKCEEKITSDVTFDVVSNTLRKSANDQFSNSAQASKIANDGIQTLKNCWKATSPKSTQDACLKNTIVSFSKSIATIKLNDAIPSEIATKNSIRNESLNELGSCLAKNLPSDITQAKDLNNDIEKCTNPLTLNVAKKVATIQIRDSAKDSLSPNEIEALIKNKVNGDFTKCLGKAPSSAILDKCASNLTIDSAKEISKKGFDKEVNKFVKENGGLASLNMSQKDLDNFLSSLSKSNNQCIDQKPKNAVAMNHINSCLKNSIKSIAMYFGDIKFNQSLGNMYDNKKEEKATLQSQFKNNLRACLSTKDDNKFSIEDFTKNLSVCSNKIEQSTTQSVATDQVDSSLNEYLKDRPGMDNSKKRKDIKNTLLSEFKTCTSSGRETNDCVDNLKRNATINIVSSYGRDETAAQLNSNTLPPVILKVEDNFKTCSAVSLKGDELSNALDACIRDYALAFAKELGELKFNFALTQALGTNAFLESKPDLDKVISKYALCLDSLKSFKMADDLTNKIAVCTKELEVKGMKIVSGTLNNWMSTEDKSLANQKIKDAFATFLPCLSVLLPASPYTPVLEKNIDSIMKPVAKLLAQYIEYNPENAEQTLLGVLSKLRVDLGDATQTHQAKVEILNFIYREGTLDQFLKSFIKGEVTEAFKNVSSKDIPEDLKSAMLERSNFEKIFNTPEGEKMKENIYHNILKPLLLENKDLKTPEMQALVGGLQNQVVKILIDAPTFGKAAIKVNVQSQINAMNGLKKFVAKAIYGKDSLDWDKVRQTAEGQKAEAYITEKILGPKFAGTTVSASEMKKINAEAEKLVTEAVKKYKHH